MKGIRSKIQAKFAVPEGDANEFIRSNDKRNRHRVSLKICKNKEDGALLRPMLPPKTEDKEQVHSTMLNENNFDIANKTRVNATKQVMDDYHNEKGMVNYQLLKMWCDEMCYRPCTKCSNSSIRHE